MARRYTASEVLEKVFELDINSAELKINEDSTFPLPVAYSDDESDSLPPASPRDAHTQLYMLLLNAESYRLAHTTPPCSPTLAPMETSPSPPPHAGKDKKCIYKI